MSLFSNLGKVLLIFKIIVHLLDEVFDRDGNLKPIDGVSEPESETENGTS